MSKKRRRTQPPRQSQDAPRKIRVVEYEITSAPIQDQRYRRLPRQVKEAFDQLYYQAQRRPHEAIPELQKWIAQYPDIPLLYNYLSIAYSAAGRIAEAEAVVQTSYQRNPDYLFARLNYAELCLAKGDYAQVAEIFDHKFDLKLLYPERKRFHISEVANFMGLIGIYFFDSGDRDTATKYYDLLQQLAPNYPVAKQLRSRLFPNLLQRMLRRLVGQVPPGP
jgi:tetratricopeptide (TPR) repeat protein